VRWCAGLVFTVLFVAGGWATLDRLAQKAVSVDGYVEIAQTLRTQARPGDLLVVMQGYDEGGLAYGLAETTADSGYAAQLRARLPRGDQPTVEVRRVVSVAPWRTTAFGKELKSSGTLWLFSHDPITVAQRSGLDPRLAECIRGQSGTRESPHGADLLVRFRGCGAP
jgi:hypothetical protein